MDDNFQLTNRQIAALRATHKTLRDRRLADRIKAVVLLGSGWSVASVAEALLVDEKTVRLWFEKYRRGGEKELLAMFYQGRAASLDDDQLTELAKHLDEKTYLDSNEIRHHIAKKYGVKYSSSGVKKLLHRLGFVYKKPKHVPGKLDPEAQAAFFKTYKKLRKNKGENDPIIFADACHPQHNSIPAYGWIRRGVEKELKSNGGRRRVNIHGAVDIDTMETFTDFAKTIDAKSSLRLFRKLIAKYPNAKKIHVFVDNATYYTSTWLRQKLRGTKIVLHFLPAYSPNLNLIERLWKFFKKKILYNQFYETFASFLSACKSFFRSRTKYRDDLHSMLAENFHLYQGV